MTPVSSKQQARPKHDPFLGYAQVWVLQAAVNRGGRICMFDEIFPEYVSERTITSLRKRGLLQDSSTYGTYEITVHGMGALLASKAVPA